MHLLAFPFCFKNDHSPPSRVSLQRHVLCFPTSDGVFNSVIPEGFFAK